MVIAALCHVGFLPAAKLCFWDKNAQLHLQTYHLQEQALWDVQAQRQKRPECVLCAQDSLCSLFYHVLKRDPCLGEPAGSSTLALDLGGPALGQL